MPPSRPPERMPALLIVCALTLACLVIAALGVGPPAVSARELLGAPRDPGERAFIAGHRGDARGAPENTLPAVRGALDAGWDYVEIDVALTADGAAVLMHDVTVDRTTDGRGALAELSLAAVRRLDAGSWFDRSFAGTPVPTAEEALDVIADRGGRVVLDLKGAWTPSAVQALVDAISARRLTDSVVLAAFDARTLALFESAAPAISRLVTLRRLPADVVEAVREVGARGVVVSRKALDKRPETVDALHEAGLRVVVYTLNDDAAWRAATALGVDGIVTDDAGTLASWQAAEASG
jgi:glycerophosphoryl diester phosphodiesterase